MYTQKCLQQTSIVGVCTCVCVCVCVHVCVTTTLSFWMKLHYIVVSMSKVGNSL